MDTTVCGHIWQPEGRGFKPRHSNGVVDRDFGFPTKNVFVSRDYEIKEVNEWRAADQSVEMDETFTAGTEFLRPWEIGSWRNLSVN